jgi:hypothetical protein
MTQFSDDYEAAPRSLREIEELAETYLGVSGLLPGDWIDPFEFMSELGLKDEVLSTKKMNGAHSFANATVNTISMTWEMSKGLREENPYFRYVWGHEIGHLMMHRGPGLKARRAGAGNKSYSFIPRANSAEFQAWIFSRALFIPRSMLLFGFYEDMNFQLGVPEYAIDKRLVDLELDQLGHLFQDHF